METSTPTRAVLRARHKAAKATLLDAWTLARDLRLLRAAAMTGGLRRSDPEVARLKAAQAIARDALEAALVEAELAAMALGQRVFRVGAPAGVLLAEVPKTAWEQGNAGTREQTATVYTLLNPELM